MASELIKGIVIKSQDFEQKDKIITILTENEILTFIALGVKKIESKNRVALELGNLIEAEIFRARLQGKLSKLKKAHIIKQAPIKTNDTSEVIHEIIKIMQWIQIPSQKLFKAFLDVYDFLGTKYNDWCKTYLSFYFLDSIGEFPITEKCAECNTRNRIIDFNFFKGGFLCVNHSNKKTDIKILKSLKSLATSIIEYKECSPRTNIIIYKMIIEYIKSNTMINNV